MKKFMDKNFLLETKTAQKLFQACQDEPLWDYHCHLIPAQIAENKKFKNLPPGAVEIYIGNLSYDTTEDYLRKEFEKFGAVASVRIITNHFTHKSKGFGFIEMPNRSEAEKAIAALNETEMHGRKLHINEARNNKN